MRFGNRCFPILDKIGIIRRQGVFIRKVIIIDFKDLQKEDKPVLDAFFHSRYYENSHFNFTNFYMWRKPFHIMWTVEDEVLYMKAVWKDRAFAMQPFGPEEKLDTAIGRLLDWFRETEQPVFFSGIERSFAERLKRYQGASFEIQEDRDNYDYVYSSQDLITLAGRKFHSKKNHLNSFRKNYAEAEYQPITEEIVTQCKLNINGWYKQRAQENPDDPFIAAEREAILEVLNNFADFGLKGGAIFVGKRVVAFTFGEQLNTDTAVIHVEKADPEVRGAYPAINQAFVEHAWSDMTYINREEDMGIEGLRKAKESYKPVKMIEKFNAVLKK